MSNQDKYTELSCNCTTTERAFLDEIREKGGYYRIEESGFIDSGICIEDSILRQHDFKTPLKELVNE